VHKYVRRHGLPRSTQRVRPTQIEEVIGLYKAGRSVESTSQELDVGATTVRRALVVTITDSSPDSITEIPQASIGVVGLF